MTCFLKLLLMGDQWRTQEKNFGERVPCDRASLFILGGEVCESYAGKFWKQDLADNSTSSP